MPTTVSLINMKGGVDKTTLAAQLAHAAANDNLRTLAVDLARKIRGVFRFRYRHKSPRVVQVQC